MSDPATTAEIANAGDFVADFSSKDLTNGGYRKKAIRTHTSYAHVVKGKMTYEPVLAHAANWVASLIHGPGPAGRWTTVTVPVPQGGYAP